MFPTPRQNCLLTLSVLVLFAAQAIAEESPQPIDYMRQIRPILSQNCFSCHGPDESSREAGLRLDQREGALALLDSGSHAIKPGNLKNSELWNRVTTKDESLKMPPLESGRKLTAVTRSESASPATGSPSCHKYEQNLLLEEAFAPHA